MKTKRERFESVAAGRVQKVIDALESLGKCANPRNYEYTSEDIAKMERVFKEKSRQIFDLYKNGLGKGTKAKFKF